MTWEAAGFVRNLKQEKALQQVQAAGQAVLLRGPHNPADPMVLEVSVADRDAVWGLWSTLEVNHRGDVWDLGARLYHLQTATLPLSDSSWLRLGFIETEHLTMGHQVPMRPDLPIMSWVLLDPSGHKVGCAQQQSIIQKKWYIYTRSSPSRF